MAPDMEIESNAMHNTPSIILDQMPQQANIKTHADDWTGQSNQAERRRRQNRLNQRAYRKRKEAEAKRHSQPRQTSGASSYSSDEDSSTALVRQDIGPWQTFSSAIASSEPQISTLSRVAVLLDLDFDKSDKTIAQFHKWIARNHMTGSPTADQALILIKFNIFRALVHNASTLSLPFETMMEDDALSPFTTTSQYKNNLTTHQSFLYLPAALRPTAIQCQIPHHPWIDLLPVPRMRDTLILAADVYDEFNLCEDMCGLYNQKSGTGLIIWGEPWDPTGWEITPHFLSRWAWTLKGCEELMISTNYWRERRGERPLNFRGFEEKIFEIS